MEGTGCHRRGTGAGGSEGAAPASPQQGGGEEVYGKFGQYAEYGGGGCSTRHGVREGEVDGMMGRMATYVRGHRPAGGQILGGREVGVGRFATSCVRAAS